MISIGGGRGNFEYCHLYRDYVNILFLLRIKNYPVIWIYGNSTKGLSQNPGQKVKLKNTH